MRFEQTLVTCQTITEKQFKTVLYNEPICKEFPKRLLFIGEGRVQENEGCLNLSSIRNPHAVWKRNNDKSLPKHQ